MKQLHVKLENCYGIKSLDAAFDFSAKRLFVVYAPNGVMKTSFAKTFQDLSGGKDSVDRVFKDRETKREIKDETGKPITGDQVFVVEPYNQDYKSSKISTLLVNKALKEQYDQIYLDIETKKEALVKGLKKSSGLKNDLEETLADSIAHDRGEFFLSLVRIQQEVVEAKKTPLADVPYSKIFNDKVSVLLESQEFREKLAEYIKIYDQLIAASTFFKKGIFNHNNAADIAKNLKDNGFFKATHSIYVNAENGKREVKTEAELENLIQSEKETILNDATLVKSFEEIDKKIARNKEVKEFRDYLEKNQFILPELNNLPRFKQKLWVAYVVANVDAYKELMDVYGKGKEKIDEIVQSARKEATKWQHVIRIFNERFSVPFVVTMENQDDVILKSEAPNIKFNFREADNSKSVAVEENDLLLVLSNGEKRALYILNIIFEVEARKEAKQKTLFVIDDIADSFDYKNKYAIIEYLHDISKVDDFYEIILTHNFDFYRTVGGRLSIPRPNRLHTVKSSAAVKFIEEKYQNNPFSHWKDNINNDEMLVASIPFIRNLAEYCGFQAHFSKLTSLLHVKHDTNQITIADVEAIIKDVLKDKAGVSLQGGARKLKDLIYDLADKIFGEAQEVIELEKKIVLSVAIRLRTEEFLIKKIADEGFVNAIKSNQTSKLIEKFKDKFANEQEQIKVAEQVSLMTPENIHINSFMYEPILDMSNEHLKQLYKKVCSFS